MIEKTIKVGDNVLVKGTTKFGTVDQIEMIEGANIRIMVLNPEDPNQIVLEHHTIDELMIID